MSRPGPVRAAFELGRIVFLRFRPLPRVWAIWLVAVNGAGLVFIGHREAQYVVVAGVVAALIQVVIYRALGFVRILGLSHLVWLPLFAWLALRLDAIAEEPLLAKWLLVLVVSNAVCLVVDAIDTVRYVRGERAPHYELAGDMTRRPD